MANILAIESCTSVCSVSFLNKNQQVTRFVDSVEKPSSLLLSLCKEVLDEANINLSAIDYLAYSRGPGAFTGVRLCLGVVQGLSLAHNIPTLGFSTLEVLGFGLRDEENVLTALDARMGEVYWARYQFGKLQQEGINKPCDLPKLEDNTIGIGSGWDQYHLLDNLCAYEFVENKHPSAQDLAILAFEAWQNNTCKVDDMPRACYFRNQVAVKKS